MDTKDKPKPRKNGSIEHRLRVATEQTVARESGSGRQGTPRPKPSMPKMPWDKDKDNAAS